MDKLDSIVKPWIYGTIILISPPKHIPTEPRRQVWLNLRDVFQVNKEAKSIQLDNEL